MRKLTNLEITKKRITLDNLHNAKKFPLYVILDNIRSMYNVGSIFRTSDAFMIEKLFLTGFTPTPLKKEVLKTALGSTESIAWEYFKEPVEIIERLKRQKVKIVSLEITDNSHQLDSISKIEFPICLIVGNEITGIQNKILELCDYSIEIEQFGIKHSLNVAVAYGIAIYKLRELYSKN